MSLRKEVLPGFLRVNLGLRGKRTLLGQVYVSAVIAKFGEAASVVVDVRTKRDEKGTRVEVTKFAGPHDLRRSFGERWAVKVVRQVLMELMRHELIETTQEYYVGWNARRTADVLWQIHEAANGKWHTGGSEDTPRQTTKAVTRQGLGASWGTRIRT